MRPISSSGPPLTRLKHRLLSAGPRSAEVPLGVGVGAVNGVVRVQYLHPDRRASRGCSERLGHRIVEVAARGALAESSGRRDARMFGARLPMPVDEWPDDCESRLAERVIVGFRTEEADEMAERLLGRHAAVNAS